MKKNNFCHFHGKFYKSSKITVNNFQQKFKFKFI